MINTFERFYRELGRGTALVLFAALGFLGMSLVSALAGFSHATAGFRDAAFSLACVFVGLLALFLVSSVVAVLVRNLNRPAPPIASHAARAEANR